MQLQWTLKQFDTLSAYEVYKILQLRIEVFIVEQGCAFQDADEKDLQAWHLCCWDGNRLAAYTRILAPGTVYEQASVGRVITAPFARGKGIGRELFQRSVDTVYQLFGKVSIKIGAQLYLKKFYESFGFIQDSAIYLEDNIEHIKMILP